LEAAKATKTDEVTAKVLKCSLFILAFLNKLKQKIEERCKVIKLLQNENSIWAASLTCPAKLLAYFIKVWRLERKYIRKE